MTHPHAFTHIHTDRHVATWLLSQQGDTSIMSHNHYLFFVVRTFMICSLSSLQSMIQKVTSLRKRYQCHPSETQACCDCPGGPVVTTLYFQYREHGFNPWLGNQDPTCRLTKKLKRKETEACSSHNGKKDG